MNIKRTVLFLTGCINPKRMAYTVLNDPLVRRQQYVDAINWYLYNTTLQILFVENSNNDLSNDFVNAINEKKLEILTFDGNDYDRSKGKGYGEALIIDYGMRHSKFLNTSSSDVFVIKVTGRLICNNISKLYMRYNHKNTVYANINKDDWNGNIANSQVVMAPMSFWRRVFLPKKENINDTLYCHFEHVLYDSIMEWIRNGGYHREFWEIPIIEGISGTSGIKIDNADGLMLMLRYRLMYILRRFFGYRGYENPFYHGQPKAPIG